MPLETNMFASFEKLPKEMIQAILTKVPARDILKCRAVSKLWNDAVDSLPDSHWKEVCGNEVLHASYKHAQKTSSLTWFQTFKAVNSWSEIETANFDCRVLPLQYVQQIKILPNKTLAMLINTEQKANQYHHYGDVIVYYNVETFEQITRNTYEYKYIQCFEENENLLVLCRFQNMLSYSELALIEKVNGKHQHHLVRNVRCNLCLDSGFYNSWSMLLVRQKIYFQSDDYDIYVSDIKDANDGSMIIPTALVVEGSKKFHNYIVHWSNRRYSDIFINLRTELRKYICDWTSLKVHKYCESLENMKALNQIDITCVSLHGKTVLLGTRTKSQKLPFQSQIEIYYNPFNPCGELIFDNARPVKIIDLQDLAIRGPIYQIEVVEGRYHHYIIAFGMYQVHIIKFEFDKIENTSTAF